MSRKLPKNPKKGKIYKIKVKNKTMKFKATGKKGFGKYKIVK